MGGYIFATKKENYASNLTQLNSRRCFIMVNISKLNRRPTTRVTLRKTIDDNYRLVQMSSVQFAFYKFLEYLTIFLIGGLVYIGIEIGFRGYTHWSMFILGGLCLVIVGLLNEVPLFPKNFGLIPQGILGSIVITILEFITGLIVNVWLGWDIWDYSDLPLNIMGQICLPFTLAWFALSIVAIVVDDYIRYWFFGEEKPTYSWWTYRVTESV